MGRRSKVEEEEPEFERAPRVAKKMLDAERKRQQLPTINSKGDTVLKSETVIVKKEVNKQIVEEAGNLMSSKVKRRLSKQEKDKVEKDARKAKLEAEKKADPYGLTRLQTIPARVQKMVELCTSVIADPVKNLENMDVLFSLYALQKQTVRREMEQPLAARNESLIRAHITLYQQVFMSIVATFKDILPNYRIGESNRNEALEKAKEEGVRLSRRVEQEIAAEKDVLNYHARLLDIMKRDFIQHKQGGSYLRSGVMAAAALLEAAPAFNKREDLLKILANQTNADDVPSAQRAEDCLETILEGDADLDIAAELSRFLGEIAKSKPQDLSARALNALSSLNLAARKAAADREWKMYGELDKVSEEVRRDLLQGAIHDPKKVRANEKVLLTEAVIIYMRVIRNPKQFQPAVLPAALRGLATHAIHVNVEMLAELMAELAKLCRPESGVHPEARLSALDAWLRLARMAASSSVEADPLLQPDPSSMTKALVSILEDGLMYLQCADHLDDTELQALLAANVNNSSYQLQQSISKNIQKDSKATSFIGASIKAAPVQSNSQAKRGLVDEYRTDFTRRVWACVEATSDAMSSKVGEHHALSMAKIIESLLAAALSADWGVAEELIALVTKIMRKHPKAMPVLEPEGLIVSPLVPPITVHCLLQTLSAHMSPEIRSATKRLAELPDNLNKAPISGGKNANQLAAGLGVRRAAWDFEWLTSKDGQHVFGEKSTLFRDLVKAKEPSSDDEEDDADLDAEDYEWQSPEQREWGWMLEGADGEDDVAFMMFADQYGLEDSSDDEDEDVEFMEESDEDVSDEDESEDNDE